MGRKVNEDATLATWRMGSRPAARAVCFTKVEFKVLKTRSTLVSTR
jgi:hypothetical protein